MKRQKFLSFLGLIMILFLAACGPVVPPDTASKLQDLANAAQTAIATVAANPPGAGPTTAAPVTAAPITDVVARPQATATATAEAPIPVTNNAPAQAPVAENSLLAAFEGTLEQVYAKVNPSVVNIQVESNASGTSSRSNPFGQGIQESLGSGFVWDTQGHIVTNYHVVEGASRILVTFASGSTVSAELVGADANADLAVIKVNVPAGELQPVVLADSTQVKVGQLAIAIGNPYGLSGTMTEGIISGLARSLPVGQDDNSPFGSQTGSTYSIPDIIQTDAAINPGNSGGVLVDDQGQVIGVTAAIQSATNANSGIGFVIPSAIVKRVVPSIISTGTYEHPFIGISGVSLYNDLAAAMNLDANQKGVLIIDVSTGTPAERAGLRGSSSQTTVSGQAFPVGGDVIIALDGHAINRIEDLTSYLMNNTQVGQTVTLMVLRQGQEQAVQVTLGALPGSSGE